MVDFDNLEVHLLANVNVEIANGLHIYLGTGQERLNAKDVYDETTFGAALDIPLDDHVFLFRLVDLIPSAEDPGRAVRNHQLAVLVFLSFDENGNDIAFLQVRVVSEFTRTDDAFRFVANVDNNFLLGNGNDGSVNHFLFLDQVQRILVSSLQRSAVFSAVIVDIRFKSIPVKITGLCKCRTLVQHIWCCFGFRRWSFFRRFGSRCFSCWFYLFFGGGSVFCLGSVVFFLLRGLLGFFAHGCAQGFCILFRDKNRKVVKAPCPRSVKWSAKVEEFSLST